MRRISALAIILFVCVGTWSAHALAPGRRLLFSTQLNPATSSWVAAVQSAGGTVSAAQKTRINKLILDLKAAGYFQLCDRIWLRAAENAQQALIDLIHNAASTNHGATFAANIGFTGDGLAQFVDTGYNPTTNNVQYTQNSGSLFVYVTNGRTTGSQTDIGSYNGTLLSAVQPFFASKVQGYVNASGTSFNAMAPTASSQGFWGVSRTTSSLTSIYKNGSSTTVGTGTITSAAPPSLTFWELALDDNGTGLQFTTDTIANSDICSGFTGAQAAQFMNIINTDYMIPLGINVY